MVEFAIALPVVLLLLLGIMEFAILVFSYSTIANAAREGARYGIVHPGETGGGTCAGSPAGMVGAACQLTTALVRSNTFVDATNVTGDSVTVTVSYTSTLITAPIIQAVGGNPIIHLNAEAKMRREQ